jgi:hypothetical protein
VCIFLLLPRRFRTGNNGLDVAPNKWAEFFVGEQEVYLWLWMGSTAWGRCFDLWEEKNLQRLAGQKNL